MNTYLVFERAIPTGEQPGDVRVPDGRGGWQLIARNDDGVALLPYACVGAVRAADEHTACMAVAKATRRLGVYAALPATLIDFAPATGGDEASPELNPGPAAA